MNVTARQQGAAPDRLQLRSFLAALPAAGELGRCAAAPAWMRVIMKTMKLNFPVLMILAVCGLILALPVRPETKSTSTQILKAHNGKHWLRVRLVQGPLRKDRNKVEGSGTKTRLNGKPEWNKDGSKNWQGTDGGAPYSEFYTFEVIVDGKSWVVPKRLYQDCYEPNFNTQPDGDPRVWAWLAKDGQTVTIKMWASDGAGSYRVLWRLRSNGKHERKIYYSS